MIIVSIFLRSGESIETVQGKFGDLEKKIQAAPDAPTTTHGSTPHAATLATPHRSGASAAATPRTLHSSPPMSSDVASLTEYAGSTDSLLPKQSTHHVHGDSGTRAVTPDVAAPVKLTSTKPKQNAPDGSPNKNPPTTVYGRITRALTNHIKGRDTGKNPNPAATPNPGIVKRILNALGIRKSGRN